MSTSTTATTAMCQDWCESHHEVEGTTVHLSSLDTASNGTVTALKMRTATHGELALIDCSVVVFEPSDTARTTPEAWQREWLRAIAAA